MAGFMGGRCVGEDGHKAGDPYPCHPLRIEAYQWGWGWAGDYTKHH